MSVFTFLRRSVAGALVLAASLLPATADAQTRTYRYDGNLTFGGFDVPLQILLAGDAATATPVQDANGVITGHRNTGLSGGLFVFGNQPFGDIPEASLFNALVPVPGTFPVAGLYATNTVGGILFFLTGAGLAGSDLSALFGPVAVTLHQGSYDQSGDFSSAVVGQGTFEVLNGNLVPQPPVSTVPEPASVGLVAVGLVVVVGRARQRRRVAP